MIMFGTNPVAKARSASDGFLVHSLFMTLQGEGPWAGKPAIFLRLAGCNLRCHFCDTEFTAGARPMTLELLMLELRSLAAQHNCHRIVITGGEPMLQPLTDLIKRGWRGGDNFGGRDTLDFQIETAGTVWPEGFDEVADEVTIVCSPKTPKLHPRFTDMGSGVYYKYIIFAGKTNALGLPHDVYVPSDTDMDGMLECIYVQPCDEGNPETNAANLQEAVQSALAHGYTLSIQLHKLAGVP